MMKLYFKHGFMSRSSMCQFLYKQNQSHNILKAKIERKIVLSALISKGENSFYNVYKICQI